jgi:hypothetical protein
VVLALYACGLTVNMIVGVIARATAGVFIRAAARADAKADAKVTARNKLIILIVMWGICYDYHWGRVRAIQSCKVVWRKHLLEV